jgi:hypothetical protein
MACGLNCGVLHAHTWCILISLKCCAVQGLPQLLRRRLSCAVRLCVANMCVRDCVCLSPTNCSGQQRGWAHRCVECAHVCLSTASSHSRVARRARQCALERVSVVVAGRSTLLLRVNLRRICVTVAEKNPFSSLTSSQRELATRINSGPHSNTLSATPRTSRSSQHVSHDRSRTLS